MKTTETPVIVSEIFHTSLGNVWNAITVLDKMTPWYFDNIPAFEPKVGFSTEFAVESEGRTFTHVWEITEVVPKKQLTYNWKYKEYPGDSFVTFILAETPKGVMLTLKTTVTEDFPDTIPEFKRESCVQGWEYFIKGRLKDYLA